MSWDWSCGHIQVPGLMIAYSMLQDHDFKCFFGILVRELALTDQGGDVGN